MQIAGTYIPRNTFPQLPWGTLKNPSYIKTEQGDTTTSNAEFGRQSIAYRWMVQVWTKDTLYGRLTNGTEVIDPLSNLIL